MGGTVNENCRDYEWLEETFDIPFHLKRHRNDLITFAE